jgi:hypothetical protein
VIGQRLVQVVSEEPADAQAISGHLHKLPLTADVLEEHDQLQAEEDLRVDAGTTRRGVAVLHQISHE